MGRNFSGSRFNFRWINKTAAFFGIIMNLSFLLSGTVSVNPNLLILTMFILVAGQNAGRIGLDGYVFPKLFRKTTTERIN